MKSFLLIFTGLAAGIVLAISCDDSSPPGADAAPMCDCPSAEPPITSQRIVEVMNTATLPPVTSATSGRGPGGAACPIGSFPISGSCQSDDGLYRDIILEEFAVGKGGAGCSWKNNTNAEVVMRVTVRCLVPAT